LTARDRIILLCFVAPLAAVLIVYSQTQAFVWDEGFHLVAASLIAAGKIPYVDFCFPQTPLNAYWNAGLIRLFGQSWQMPHLFAALFIVAAAAMAADFVSSHLPVKRWSVACGACAAAFICLNTVVLQFGPVGQAYGICLFFGMASFRSAVAAVGKTTPLFAVMAGLMAGAAAGSSLLTAPVIPIVLLWIWVYNRAGNRWTKSLAYACAAVVPFAPVIWLFFKAPRQTLFNIAQYQAIYRRMDWPGATLHDFTTLISWSNSTQSLSMLLLTAAAVWFVYKQAGEEGWDGARRAEFYLAGWLAAGLTLFIATAHPTFERYFIVMVPFAGILASAGLWSICSKLGGLDRPWPVAIVAITLIALALGQRQLEDTGTSTTWKDYGEISQKVGAVTPPGARLYADEVVYFQLRRTPPEGMEFSYSHKLDLPREQAKLFHLVSERELKEQIQKGQFATVQTCKDDVAAKYKLSDMFSNKVDIQDCSIYWSPKKSNTPENVLKH
jgi:hypothetical protein